VEVSNFLTAGRDGSGLRRFNDTKKESVMLIKMKESKGFTLVELMIVVAIIGILAAVAVPFYQRYIQKSRMTSKVFPGMHSIETNVGTFYSFQQTFPTNVTVMAEDADTYCFDPSFNGATLQIRIAQNRCTELESLREGGTILAAPQTDAGKIQSWFLTGPLATKLGLQGEG
jgi:type IV pilus assembly protein PilA